MDSSNEITERAIALGAGGDVHNAVRELIRLAEGHRGPLEGARDALVGRIRTRSDDYEASGGLTAINAALAEVGWPAGVTWQPRKWRLPRRF